ncbi:MAG: hypothetical protein WCL31_05120 [Actinomycetes bacterium]|jgi:hypothetical protein
MAVRILDLTETDRPPLRVVETVLSRRDLRRIRHRWEILGLGLLIVPFLVTLVSLGVSH